MLRRTAQEGILWWAPRKTQREEVLKKAASDGFTIISVFTFPTQTGSFYARNYDCKTYEGFKKASDILNPSKLLIEDGGKMAFFYEVQLFYFSF